MHRSWGKHSTNYDHTHCYLARRRYSYNCGQTRRRCSLPYFLLPKLEGDLVPFGAETTGRTRDRGLAYAVDRCNLWGAEAYERWYGEEVEQEQEEHEQQLQLG